MRLATLISFAVLGLTFSEARADEPFEKIALGDHGGYIIPEGYANAHKADLLVSLPGLVKVDGFWTPPEQDVRVADRILHDLIDSAVKDPGLLFPDLASTPGGTTPDRTEVERERKELALIAQNYPGYQRQYVGIIIEGNRLVLCNYAEGTKADSAVEYIYMEKFFVSGEKTHFLQIRVDSHWKTWANVSIVGSWLPEEKR